MRYFFRKMFIKHEGPKVSRKVVPKLILLFLNNENNVTMLQFTWHQRFTTTNFTSVPACTVSCFVWLGFSDRLKVSILNANTLNKSVCTQF